MKLTRQKLEEMIGDVLGEEEEMQGTEDGGAAITEADEILVQLEKSIARLEELALGVGHVKITKQFPELLQLQDYISDLSHPLRARMEEAQLKE